MSVGVDVGVRRRVRRHKHDLWRLQGVPLRELHLQPELLACGVARVHGQPGRQVLAVLLSPLLNVEGLVDCSMNSQFFTAQIYLHTTSSRPRLQLLQPTAAAPTNAPSYRLGMPGAASGPSMRMCQVVIGSYVSRVQPSGGLRVKSRSSLCGRAGGQGGAVSLTERLLGIQEGEERGVEWERQQRGAIINGEGRAESSDRPVCVAPPRA